MITMSLQCIMTAVICRGRRGVKGVGPLPFRRRSRQGGNAGGQGYSDMTTGVVMWWMMVLVTPPKAFSRRREWL